MLPTLTAYYNTPRSQRPRLASRQTNRTTALNPTHNKRDTKHSAALTRSDGQQTAIAEENTQNTTRWTETHSAEPHHTTPLPKPENVRQTSEGR